MSSPQPALAGASELAASDLGPLAWVLEELRKSLDGATKALRRFVRDAELARGSNLSELDASQLRIARQQLHQAVGALEMVGLGAPAQMLRAMETLAQKFVQRPDLCSDEAATRVERASFALTEYLEGLLKGKQASPVALFPQYRAVAELAGGDKVHPADLWPAQWRWMDVTAPDGVAAQDYTPGLRAQMDQLVLRVMRSGDARAAARLCEQCAGLARSQERRESRTFWMVAAGFFEALALGLCPADVYSKRAASRILRQFATLARGEPEISDRLAFELLFFCSIALPAEGQEAAFLDAVRSAYGLGGTRAVQYEVEQFGRFDPSLMVLARKRIAAAAETWSALAGGDTNRLKVAAEQFGAVAESVVKLHPESVDLARALVRATESTVRSAAAPEAPVAMEVATAILYLEAAYDDLDPTETAHMAARSQRLAQRLEHVCSGGESEPLESWMEELYRRVSDRQTMGSVVDELRLSLAEVEKSLDQFFRNPKDKSPLREVPSQLAQMRGVFSVLGLDQPSMAALRMRASVEQFLVDDVDAGAARSGVFEKIGNSLGALGFLIDMLSYQRTLAKKLFIYDEDLGEFRPLMGRERVPDAADDEAKPTTPTLPPRAEPTQVTAPEPQASAVDLVLPAGEPQVAVEMAATPLPSPVAAAEPAELSEDEAELIAIFLDEAREVVQTGLAAIAALREEPANLAEQTTLRRAFHTLKGSSRMVGLNQFGEAAWAFEQVLNNSLAEQRPASTDLMTGTSTALQAFGRWIEDIATQQAFAWDAQPFRRCADILRLQGQWTDLELPSAAPSMPAAPASGAQEVPTPEAQTAPASTDFAATDVSDSAFFSATQPVSDSLLPEPAAPSGFASTQTMGFEATQPATPVDAAIHATEVQEIDFGEFDFGAIGTTPEPALTASSGVGEAIEPVAEAAPEEVPEIVLDLVAELPPVSEAVSAEPAEPAEVLEWDSASLPDDAIASVVAIEPVQQDDFASEAETSHGELVFELAAEPEPAPLPADPEVLVEPPAAVLEDVMAMEALPEPEPEALTLPIAEPEPTQSVPALSLEVGLPPDLATEDAQELAQAEVEEDPVRVIGDLRLSIPLYNVYLNEADEWSRRLQVDLSEWALELPTPLPDGVIALAHSLAGSSATVGFTALSEMARLLEHALQHVQLHRQASVELAQVFSHAAEDIRRLLHQFAAGFLKPADPQLLAALQSIIEAHYPETGLDTIAAALDEDIAVVQEEVAETEHVFEPAADVLIPSPSPESLAPVVPEVHLQVAAAPLTIAQAEDDEIDAVDQLDVDLFPIFEEEAAELMPQLGFSLRQWVAHPDDARARSEVLRALHTIKGSARLAGAMRLGEMAHHMESAVEQFAPDSVQSVQLEPLLTRFDTLNTAFKRLGQAPQVDVAEIDAPIADARSPEELPGVEIASLQPGDADSAAGAAMVPAAQAPLVRVELAPIKVAPRPMPTATARQGGTQTIRVRSQLLDRLVNQAGEVMISRARLEARLAQLRSSMQDLTGNLDRLRHQLRDVELQSESQMQSRLAQAKDSAQAFDPLEFDRFTRVQELTRMMAESVHDVATVQRNLQRSIEGAEDDLIAQGRQARELQRDLLRTRMVEFESISERLYGVVRQASKDVAKAVKLDIIGGSIEMDRGVLERMAPAFEHMLRNSVAHGIESAPERLAAGKPAAGTITIEVRQEGNDVSVVFADDGVGLALERIRARAVAKGLIDAQAPISEEEAANLIFLPGFSTAEQVTELSGRGIGMDVVRAEVNALGGRIETSSSSGHGTRFKVVLPLTTAVTQVVMLRIGEFTVGVPSGLVETVLRTPVAALEQAYRVDGFEYGGQLLPFFWAGALLQVSARSVEGHGKTRSVVVFRSAGQRLAMHIDEVLGNREVVVKNLGPQLAQLPGLAGISVLASGAVALIYNPVALAAVYGPQARQLSATVAAATSPETGTSAEALAVPAPTEAVGGEGPTVSAVNQVPLILVVDDSITVRRVTQRLLKREGYRVTLASDGLDALEKLQEEKPTVVLSDIEMPRMDGFDLARNIRADLRLRDLPIIMITSRIAGKHREHAKELGVDHYLGKPYSEDELLGLVRGYCFGEVVA